MSKVICIGSACKDIFLPTDEGKVIDTPDDLLSQKKIQFEFGAKYKIKERFESLGGCAANVAAGFSRLGLETSCASLVGEDGVGEWIKKELQKNNVETELIGTQEEKSDLSAIIVDSNTAERTIFSNKNSGGELEINSKNLGEGDLIFIGDIKGDWKKQLEDIIQISKEQEKMIAYNPRETHIHEDPAEVIEAIALCDLVFLNKDEAIEIVSNMHEEISKDSLNDEKVLMEKLIGLGIKVVVITDGKRGAWAGSEGQIFFVSGLEVAAVDSTGAGDAFCSGFLSALLKEKEINECLTWGIGNSSSVVCHYGAIQGLLDEEKMQEKIKTLTFKSCNFYAKNSSNLCTSE
jgi:sugar/nucleoside kinase (ribokinase family)